MRQSLWALLILLNDLVIDIWYFKVLILSETYHFFIFAHSKPSGIWWVQSHTKIVRFDASSLHQSNRSLLEFFTLILIDFLNVPFLHWPLWRTYDAIWKASLVFCSPLWCPKEIMTMITPFLFPHFLVILFHFMQDEGSSPTFSCSEALWSWYCFSNICHCLL